MSKTGDIAKVSAKGSFHMLWGLIVSTIISSVGVIFIARLLGSDLYGLYTVVLTVPTAVSIFRDWGITSAIVKFTAQFRAEDRADEIRSIFLTGLIFEVAVGLALTVLSFFLANFIAIDVFNRPLIAPLIQIASLSILATGLVSAATSVFTGNERMELNSIMLVFQSIIKTLLIIGLVILGFSTAGATIGYTVGTVIAGVIGVALIKTIYTQLPKPASARHEIKAYLTAMLTYCLPLSIGTLIASLLAQFYAFLLPIYYAADNVQIGNYGIATTFVVLITFFATPVTTMMFPAFSKLDAKKDKETLGNIFQYSIKYASLLVIPATALVMCLAEPAVQTLFGTTYTTAPLYLALLAIQYLLTAFGLLTVSGFLNGQGETSFSLKLSIITALFGFPLGYFLIMNFGVIGFIAVTIIDGVPSLILSLFFINKKYGLSVDWWSSLKILSSTLLSSAITYLVLSELSFTRWIELLLGACIFIVVLLPLMLLSRSITRSDIANLRFMAKGLGSLSGIIDKILTLIERLITILRL
jgi:Membrane protein involved in the export of O-antigen and teichoic acid